MALRANVLGLKFNLFFSLLVLLLIGPQIYHSWQKAEKNREIIRELNSKIATSLQSFESEQQALEQKQLQAGYVLVKGSHRKFSVKRLNDFMQKVPYHQKHLFYTWRWDGVKEATASAIGLDSNSYFANSYLIGFKPFNTDSVWKPLYTLALRKKYEFDHIQYNGLQEVWQNSKQAYYHTRGDCEDHAIILADWLIEMGYNARVALGEWKNQGHAWVVLFYNGQEYVLESTSKHRPNKLSDFIYASAAIEYRPTYQFNRDKFWVNTGSKYTTSYGDEKWQMRSRFIRKYKPS